MASESCNVDCSHTIEHLSPNPDITGVGVSIANTVTAGLAVGIVILYYVFSYDPGEAASSAISHYAETTSLEGAKQNPIDVYFLNWRLRRLKKSGGCERDKSQPQQIRTALTNCMLVMSDFQLITGFALILSGFSQLDCGLSTYDWLRVTRLAWFACLTHLCCLTFLRDYFLANKAAMYWRLPAMIMLIIMLTVALMPSAHSLGYTGRGCRDQHTNITTIVRFRPTRADPVKCFWNHHIIHGICNEEVMSEIEQDFQVARQKMIVAVVLLSYGVLSRIWRLCQAPTNIYLRIRSWGAIRASRKIEELHDRVQPRTLSAAVLVVVAYRPALALMLSMRLVLDMMTCKALEVWWLILSFAWGVMNLWEHGIDASSRQWTFGQVITMMLLFAPCASLIDAYMTASTIAKKDNISCQPEHNNAKTLVLNPESRRSQASNLSFHSVEDNRLDFYVEHASFKVLVWTTLSFCGAVSSITLLYFRGGSPVQLLNPRYTEDSIMPYLAVTPASLPVAILVALSIKMKRAKSRSGRVGTNAYYWVILNWSLTMPSLSIIYRGYAVITSIALYVLIPVAFVVQRLRRLDILEIPVTTCKGILDNQEFDCY